MEFPEDRLYSKEGLWVKIEGDTAIIGLTDWLVQEVGGPAYIEYNESSDEEILSIQSQSRGYNNQLLPKPIAGKPIPGGYNQTALEHPYVIDDYYGENAWLYKMTFEKSSATKLMTAAKFRTFIEE